MDFNKINFDIDNDYLNNYLLRKQSADMNFFANDQSWNNSEKYKFPEEQNLEANFSKFSTNQGSSNLDFFGSDDNSQLYPERQQTTSDRFIFSQELTLIDGQTNQTQIIAASIGNHDGHQSIVEDSDHTNQNPDINLGQQKGNEHNNMRKRNKKAKLNKRNRGRPHKGQVRDSFPEGIAHVNKSIFRDFRNELSDNFFFLSQFLNYSHQDIDMILALVCKNYSKKRKELLFENPSIALAFDWCYGLLKQKYEQKLGMETVHSRNQSGKNEYTPQDYIEHLDRLHRYVLSIM